MYATSVTVTAAEVVDDAEWLDSRLQPAANAAATNSNQRRGNGRSTREDGADAPAVVISRQHQITAAQLQKAGVTINRPPRDGNMAFVRSPDLHSIELLQKGEPKAPAEPWVSMPNTGHW